ncbi:MAG: rRNA maturation RNase YbeY [Opitutae bacterium]|nr:rRNA maturation RNase YbeY [Opitutae bacterium]
MTLSSLSIRARDVGVNNAHPRLRVPPGAVERVVAVLDAHAEKFLGGCPPGELSVVFLTDPALAQIHADFMDDPTATDVITFEGDRATLGSEALAKEAGLAGEICVSADTARAYARAHGRDFAEELTLYVVHGWLHLAGYDDLQPAKKRRMRAAEKRAMMLLHAAKAVPAFRLAAAVKPGGRARRRT